jgi:hypothetical protein
VPVAFWCQVTVWEEDTVQDPNVLDPNPEGRDTVPPTFTPLTLPDHEYPPVEVTPSVHEMMNETTPPESRMVMVPAVPTALL